MPTARISLSVEIAFVHPRNSSLSIFWSFRACVRSSSFSTLSGKRAFVDMAFSRLCTTSSKNWLCFRSRLNSCSEKSKKRASSTVVRFGTGFGSNWIAYAR